MSLKHFHIVFISCSLILTLGFAYWAYGVYQQTHDNNYFLTSIFSGLFAVGLVIYGVLFWKKLKTIDKE